MFCTLVLLAGCAKLPLENSAPGTPILTSDGIRHAAGIEVLVSVDDPDNDKVTMQFRATQTSGTVQEFSWTSFIDSGSEEIFYLNLSLGQWTVTATAKDEWEELSGVATMDLLVTVP